MFSSTSHARLESLLPQGFLPGQLVEISGAASSGKSSLAFSGCWNFLSSGQAVAWIDAGSGFWPLPALEAQLNLDALWVVRVPEGKAALRAADLLLSCSGAVAAVVVDVPTRFHPANVQLVKLQRLAERSGTALIFLTEHSQHASSLGALVSLRLHVERAVQGAHIQVLRHKQGATQQTLEESFHGPNRLRIHSTV